MKIEHAFLPRLKYKNTHLALMRSIKLCIAKIIIAQKYKNCNNLSQQCYLSFKKHLKEKENRKMRFSLSILFMC